MDQPNFILIGAFKAGTTALADYLGQHPEVFISPVKEPHFHSFAEHPPTFTGPGDDRAISSMVLEEDAYRALFAGASSEKAVGEASASYLPNRDALAKITRDLPEARFIVVLRQPADRAYSSYLHLRRDGREPLKDFREALEAEPGRIAENYAYLWRYRNMGEYAKQLSPWIEAVGRERILIHLYDDFKASPSSVMEKTFRFLGVSPSFQPDTSTRHNVSGVPRSRWLHNFLHSQSTLRRLGGTLAPARLRRYLRKRNMHKPAFDPGLRRELTESFRSEILALADLLERDLSPWLNE